MYCVTPGPRPDEVNTDSPISSWQDKHPLPDTSDFGPNPTAPDVEWFFTAQELCTLISKVADLPLMSINPWLFPSFFENENQIKANNCLNSLAQDLTYALAAIRLTSV